MGTVGLAHGPGPNSTEQEVVYAKATAARTRGDVVKLTSSSSGYVDATASGSTIYQVAVAYTDISSGNQGQYLVRGRCNFMTTPSITTTAGHGVKVASGAVADSGSTAQVPNGTQTNNDYGVVVTAATSATTQDVYLYGYPTTNT